MKQKIKALYQKYGHILRYCVTGGVNTLVDFAVFTLVALIPGAPEAVAQAAGYTVGLVNSFIMNKRFTFRDNGRTSFKKVAVFVAINLVALGLSSLFIWLLVSNLGMNKYLAKIIVTCFTMVYNYFAYRALVFR